MTANLFAVMAKALNVPLSEISERTSRANLPEWDSLSHLVLMVRIENAFGVKFSTAELANTANVRDLRSLLKARGKAP